MSKVGANCVDLAGLSGFLSGFFLKDVWIDGLGLVVRGFCRDAGKSIRSRPQRSMLTRSRIVEYATRDQAQTAVNTLSNQNLMGRLVYVREVSHLQFSRACQVHADLLLKGS